MFVGKPDARAGLHVSGDLVVGAGSNGALKVRHIDGKDGQSDAHDALWLNWGTGHPVFVGKPDARAGLHVSGDLVVGAGSNGALKVRHIDGKDWQSDAHGDLWLNWGTGKTVFVGKPDARAPLHVSGDMVVGAGSNGVLKARHIEGKHWQNDSDDTLALNWLSGKPVHVGRPEARSSVSVSGDLVVGAGSNGALNVRHINGKDWQSDADDALYLNWGTRKPVILGQPSAKCGLEVNGNIIAENITAKWVQAPIIGAGGDSRGEVLGAYNHGTGFGVRGVAKRTTKSSFGVVGIGGPEPTSLQAKKEGGIGVLGFSQNGVGVAAFSESSIYSGVEGYSLGQSAGVFGTTSNANGVGVYGENTSGYDAGRFIGNVRISGMLSAASKSFRIDHPLDPVNKYLNHSAVESPNMMTVYNGNITTDSTGEAIVDLPSYFEILNGDFKYQLTVIGSFAQAIVKSEIEDNRFVISTDQPNVKVSWQVAGVRRDPYAEAYCIPVEQEKPDSERGMYLHPELYVSTSAESGAGRPIGSIPSMMSKPANNAVTAEEKG